MHPLESKVIELENMVHGLLGRIRELEDAGGSAAGASDTEPWSFGTDRADDIWSTSIVEVGDKRVINSAGDGDGGAGARTHSWYPLSPVGSREMTVGVGRWNRRGIPLTSKETTIFPIVDDDEVPIDTTQIIVAVLNETDNSKDFYSPEKITVRSMTAEETFDPLTQRRLMEVTYTGGFVSGVKRLQLCDIVDGRAAWDSAVSEGASSYSGTTSGNVAPDHPVSAVYLMDFRIKDAETSLDNNVFQIRRRPVRLDFGFITIQDWDDDWTDVFEFASCPDTDEGSP